MDGISRLPPEILFYILESEILSITDVVRFCQTNSTFASLIRDNLLWMKKYYQKTIIARTKHSTLKKRELAKSVNFSIVLIATTKNMKLFELFLSNYSTREEQREITTRIKIASDTSLGFYYYKNEFDRIFVQARQTPNCGRAYLARLMSYYLSLHKFIRDQNRILISRKNNVSLERQIVVVLQLIKPNISLSEVKLWINQLTEKILKKLKNVYKSRRHYFDDTETFRRWINNWENDDDFWSSERLSEIMHRVETFAFNEIDWRACPLILDEFETTWPTRNSNQIPYYITLNFQRTLPILTHYFIASKLGIDCKMNFKREQTDSLELQWTLRPSAKNWNVDKNDEKYKAFEFNEDTGYNERIRHRNFTLKNVSEKEHSISKSFQYSIFLTASVEYPLNLKRTTGPDIDIDLIYNRFFTNLQVLDGIVCFLKSITLNHRDDENSSHFFLIFSHITDLLWRCINISDYHITIEHQRFSSEMMARLKVDRFIVIDTETRRTNVKFAIGMIVVHWRNSFLHAHKGVVLGWHHNYRQAFVDKMMDFNIREISSVCDGYRFHNCRIRTHPNVIDRPYYIVLTEDSGLCYVQQERLRLEEPSEIQNVEIGRYFTRFNGLFYIPNEYMKSYYPKDSEYVYRLFRDNIESGEIFNISRISLKLGTVYDRY